MKPVHTKAALYGIIFGIISIIILILLRVQGVFLVIILWMIVPVLIKKGLDRIKSFLEKLKN